MQSWRVGATRPWPRRAGGDDAVACSEPWRPAQAWWCSPGPRGGPGASRAAAAERPCGARCARAGVPCAGGAPAWWWPAGGARACARSAAARGAGGAADGGGVPARAGAPCASASSPRSAARRRGCRRWLRAAGRRSASPAWGRPRSCGRTPARPRRGAPGRACRRRRPPPRPARGGSRHEGHDTQLGQRGLVATPATVTPLPAALRPAPAPAPVPAEARADAPAAAPPTAVAPLAAARAVPSTFRAAPRRRPPAAAPRRPRAGGPTSRWKARQPSQTRRWRFGARGEAAVRAPRTARRGCRRTIPSGRRARR